MHVNVIMHVIVMQVIQGMRAIKVIKLILLIKVILVQAIWNRLEFHQKKRPKLENLEKITNFLEHLTLIVKLGLVGRPIWPTNLVDQRFLVDQGPFGRPKFFFF